MTIAKRMLLAPAAARARATAVPALAAHHEGEHGDAPDIVEIAAGNEDFSTLVAALKAADLVDTLAGEGPFTVFAPTNAAFDALPEGTVESLLKPENKAQLSAVLTYHVVPGAVYAGDVVELSSATTVQGGDVSISTEDGRVMIDGAQVIKTDIEAENGVIHVIDAVLLPSN
jgi:uncharacterized surface protein with fasciclin (FAS1) repeats